MIVKASIAAVAACVVLAGCTVTEVRIERTQAVASSAAATHRAKKCRDEANDCEVKVSVISDSTGPRLTVDPDFVAIAENKKVAIKWTLDAAAVNAGYRFDVNRGIVIRNVPVDEFDCKPQANDKEFRCKNKHTQFGVYKYEVTVTGTPAVAPLDPWVIND